MFGPTVIHNSGFITKASNLLSPGPIVAGGSVSGSGHSSLKPDTYSLTLPVSDVKNNS